MRFYAWRVLYGAPDGDLRIGNWWISKNEPAVDTFHRFDAYKGEDIKNIKLYLKRLDEQYKDATIRKRAQASVKLIMAARALAAADKKQREKPLRATGFNWDLIR